MALPPCSRDLNSIVNLSLVHVASRHYSSKDKLWNALADAFNDLSMDTTKKFTSSADNRLLYLSFKTKIDTPTTYASLNDRKFSFKLKS